MSDAGCVEAMVRAGRGAGQRVRGRRDHGRRAIRWSGSALLCGWQARSRRPGLHPIRDSAAERRRRPKGGRGAEHQRRPGETSQQRAARNASKTAPERRSAVMLIPH